MNKRDTPFSYQFNLAPNSCDYNSIIYICFSKSNKMTIFQPLEMLVHCLEMKEGACSWDIWFFKCTEQGA